MAEEPRHKWVQIFRTAGLWSVPVRDYEEICSTPHLRDNDLLVDMSHPLLGDFSALNTPLHFDDTRAVANRPPPLLGEHTREVLADMGYGSEAIDALEASGIVGRRDQSGPG